MTLPQVKELNRYWTRNPPVHLLLAAFLGYKAPGEKEHGNDFGDLISMFGVER